MGAAAKKATGRARPPADAPVSDDPPPPPIPVPVVEPPLDPGPDLRNGVLFVKVRNPSTGGTGSVPADLLDHHRDRGWEPCDSPAGEDIHASPEDATTDPSQED
jgi:hypothetical protein